MLRKKVWGYLAVAAILVGAAVAVWLSAQTPKVIVRKIVNSVSWQDNAITFRIPFYVPEQEALTVHVEARTPEKDASLDFPEENENWKTGKIYSIPYDPAYTKLMLEITCSDGKYQHYTFRVDLLSSLDFLQEWGSLGIYRSRPFFHLYWP